MSIPARDSGPPSGEGVCARCGQPLLAATAHLSELGPVCWPCFETLQTARDSTRGQVAARERALDLRARLLSALHGVMWSATAVLASAQLPAGLGTAALVAGVALAAALFLRKRLAYAVALLADGAGALALVARGVTSAGPAWPWLMAAVFALALVALTRAARDAYLSRPGPTITAPARSVLTGPSSSPSSSSPLVGAWRWAALPRWAWLVIGAALAAGGGAAAVAVLLNRPPPEVTLLRTRLTQWQVERGQPDSAAGGPASRALLAAARDWPALATALEALDRAWPDERAARTTIEWVNQALGRSHLPYLLELWPAGDRPVVLSHRIVGRVPWRVGERTVDVLRLRRFDTLNVDFAMSGVTAEALPIVLLDRVEAELARDVPAAYGADRTERAARSLNTFDRAALQHVRAFLDQRLGTSMGTVGAALVERDRLFEQMRGRLHDGRVQFEDMPERFVLGATWLDKLRPETRSGRAGGPLIVASDLTAVVEADERLRSPEIARLLDTVIELWARSVEAHEARHAVDGATAPDLRLRLPPSRLFEAMPDSSAAMVAAADGELRAFLGEVHDGGLPACVSLATILRSLYGRGAGRTPHAYAATVLLQQIDLEPDSPLEPAEQLDALCRIPDRDLRARIEGAWQAFYAAPMPAAQRDAAAIGE